MSRRDLLLEVCVSSVEDAIVAQRAGADRIELNCALEVGGLTPSIGTIRATLESVGIPVIVMIRPRPGSFFYTVDELRLMVRDIEAVVEASADGIAIGALTAEGLVHAEFMKHARSLCEEVVFHRAFDMIREQSAALDQLCELGVARVLTSGGAVRAIDGAERLRQLLQQADCRIGVLPAGGIGPDNVIDLVRQTGVCEVHGTFRGARPGATDRFGFGEPWHVDATVVADMRQQLDALRPAED